jgi:apolipoprotein N-acyltransferase
MELTSAETIQSHFWRRWYGRLLLLLLGVGFLTAGFAPVNQFYLAWVGLVPWLVVLHGTRSQRSAFFWSWVAGTLFFIANMWWMAKVTVPGMITLMAILGLYWGVAGTIIRTTQIRFPFLRCIAIATIWVAVGESFRGTWPWHGLPWLYLGYTQSPVLAICQIADFSGVLGVSFLVALVNAWVALWVINGWKLRGLAEAGITILAIVILVVCYGVFRMGHETLIPGPKVLVIQPNYPQDNSTGNKGATVDETLAFHVNSTLAALNNNNVDLTVWSETIMPPFNPEAGVAWRKWNVGRFIDDAREQLRALAMRYHSAFLVGARFEKDFTDNSEGIPEAADKRNSAYFFDRQGMQSELRFDKIHLVPFGEFIPFKVGFPALYRLMIYLGPADMKAYGLQFGDEDKLTVFPLERNDGKAPWRFVTPICFEDIDPGLCAKMFRPEDGEKKRADFLVNITNDGWFQANENSQHLQAAIFRSIENRVPSARSVNTGISGFIDPLGRTTGLLPTRTEGTSVGVLMLDSRVTFFTRWGQLFAMICATVTSLIVAISHGSWWKKRKVFKKD